MFKIYTFDKINSTNDLAKNYPINSIIVAKEQTRGRGRFQRKWDSNKGGLWFSLVLKPKKPLFHYTFIASLAVMKALPIKANIKWPNDIIYSNKKICGILTESFSFGSEVDKVIVGIGVNINNSISSALKDIAISLKEIKGKVYDLHRLLNKVLSNFQVYDKLDYASLLEQYKSNCYLLGKEIEANTINKKIKGKAIDIDKEGCLVMETSKGILHLQEGDVSIL